jgi:hypothetical protein
MLAKEGRHLLAVGWVLAGHTFFEKGIRHHPNTKEAQSND